MKDSIVMGMSFIGEDLREGAEAPAEKAEKKEKRKMNWRPVIAAAAICLVIAAVLPFVLHRDTATVGNLFESFIAIPVSAADIYIEDGSMENVPDADKLPVRLLKPTGRNRMIIGAWDAGANNIIVFSDDCTFVVYDMCPYAPYYYEACSEGYYGIDGDVMKWYNPWESAVYNISFSLGIFGQSLNLTETESGDNVRLHKTDAELRPIEEYDGGWEQAMRILINHLDRQGCVTEKISIDGLYPESVQDPRANVVAAGFGDEYDAGWWLTAAFVAGEKGFDEAAPGERVEAGFLVARNADGWRILSRTEFRNPDGGQ